MADKKSMSMSNSEIRSSLLTIYEKLSKPSTREVGYELYKKLILQNIYYPLNQII